MTPDEAGRLLTIAASMEASRSMPDETEARSWSEILYDVSYADAIDGVRAHYRASSYPLTPSRIIEHVKVLRSQRIAAHARAYSDTTPEPPETAITGAQTAAWTRAYWKAVGDGLGPVEADTAACLQLGMPRRQELPPVERPLQLDRITRRPGGE